MKKRLFCAIIGAMLIASFTACNTQGGNASQATVAEANADQNAAASDDIKDGEYDLSFSKRDADSSYDESAAAKITFTDTSAESSTGSAEVSGTTVTIKAEGTYIVSGSCKDGKIVIDADENAKVQVVFKGIDLSSSGSPFVVKSADKVFITLADGTENAVSDSGSYSETVGETNVDAAIFSKEGISINGSGKLTVNGNYKHGIISKDDLVLAGGTVSVKSASTGVEGKDSLKIKDTDLTVEAGSDAIRSTNTEDTATKGFVYIQSGKLTLKSENDAVQASSLLRVDGGELNITTGGGSDSGKTHTEENFMRGGRMNMFSSNSDSTDTDSAKGLKAADAIKINGGTIDINSSDDALHSNNSLSVDGGELRISSGDDGLHSDTTLTVNSGTIDITKSYEGIESGEITVNDGKISVKSSDDGFNAAGGNNGTERQGMFDSDSSKVLTINGGYVYVDADGDGLDSNGVLKICGGTILVNGPSNDGNGALDSGSSCEVTGGTIIAIGSSGMAESLTANGQCSIMTDIDSQAADTSVALTDSEGNVLASINSTKQFNNVVVSTPSIRKGESYKIIVGGTVDGADSNGFVDSGKISGGSAAAEITMDSESYTNGGSHMGGGMGGMRGGDMQPPNGDNPNGMQPPNGNNQQRPQF